MQVLLPALHRMVCQAHIDKLSSAQLLRLPRESLIRRR